MKGFFMLPRLFFFVFLIGIIKFSYAQTGQINFDQLSTKDGLSFNSVITIFQDSKGFIWIGTWDGMDRYDGKYFKNYKSLPSRFSQKFLSAIEDYSGNLWFGGPDGLSIYITRYDKFVDHKEIINNNINEPLTDIVSESGKSIYLITRNHVYRTNYDIDSAFIQKLVDPESEAVNHKFKRINVAKLDSKGNLWLGTDQGLYVYQPDNSHLTRFDLLDYPQQKWIQDFLFDREGNLWVVFNRTLFKYNFDDGKLFNIDLSLYGNQILNKVIQTNNGLIYLATDHGVLYLDTEKTQVHQLLNKYEINDIFEDQSHRLWIGTASSGVLIYDSLKNYFKSLPLRINGNSVTSYNANIITLSRKNGLWIGSWDMGLFFYDFKSKNTIHIDKVNNQINALMEGNNGIVWYDDLGSHSIVKYNQKSNTIRKIRHPIPYQFPIANDGNSITNFKAYNTELIITSDYGNTYLFDPDLEEFELIYENKEQHITPIRSFLIEDNRILMPVFHIGVVEMDNNFNIKNILYQPEEDQGLYKYHIMAIQKDQFDTFWVGGFGGLSKFNPEKQLFENKLAFTESFNYITSILEDGKGNLWIGSSKGIYKYDRKKQQIKLFDVWDGIPPGRFMVNSAVKTDDGRMFFGGNNGIVYFDPDQVKTNQKPPPVVFTGFDVREKPGKPNQSILEKNINYTEKINLKYWQNFFTIHYAALNYTSPQQNQYKYLLEGVDKDWNLVGNQTQANFTGIKSGEYTFSVMGSNNEGIWSKEARSIQIAIAPPPWLTWWAYVAYILLLGAIVIIIYRYNIRRIKIRHQLKLKNQEAQKLMEIDQAKTQFFTNISHEFRTPLSLILDPAKQLLNQNNLLPYQNQFILLIKQNAERLLHLINQILDLAKLENGKLKLMVQETAFISFVKPIVHSFGSQAENLNIKYKLIFPDNEIKIWIDREKVEKIVINLLSNAFKFCTKGQITFQILENDYRVAMIVKDTGIGISSEKIEHIFEKFFQVDTDNQNNLAGTGIGLALVKEYVELHQGTIHVKSELNHGTEFNVHLLKGNDHFVPNQIINNIPKYRTSENSCNDSLRNSYNQEPKFNGSKILIVEDNQELLLYLKQVLSDHYQVITATNGEEGLEKTLQFHPEMVISDIMMPVMDGYSLCKKIKEDLRTNHIPVILLTAKNSKVNKLTGLDIGADDYLYKPFDSRELKLRIKNLIEQRNRFRSKFIKEFKLQENNELVISQKNQFLQKVITHIEENLQNEQFSVEILSEQMCMSRKHLHRKLKTLTDHTPNDLIRKFRLRKAAYLLSEKAGSVTDICYKVGFNSPSYFSKCFYNYYGKNPSDFQNLYH